MSAGAPLHSKWDFSWSDFILMLGGKIYILIFSILILNFGTDQFNLPKLDKLFDKTKATATATAKAPPPTQPTQKSEQPTPQKNASKNASKNAPK